MALSNLLRRAPRGSRKPARLGLVRLEARDTPAVSWAFHASTGHLTVQVFDRAAKAGEFAGANVDVSANPNTSNSPIKINGNNLAIGGGQILRTTQLKQVTVYGSEANNVLSVTLLTRTPGLVNLDNKIKIYGYGGNDNLNGSGYADHLFGGNNNDWLDGNGGNDKLYGEAGNDKLFGGAGNDYLNGGSGNDTMDGGSGTDSVAFYSSAQDKKYFVEVLVNY